jgi:ubiquinone/menaquinone biosynthesis C-methylase UbiE
VLGSVSKPMSDDPNSADVIAQPITERYSQRDNPEFEVIMALRTAKEEGAFFLHHLCSGMRVLDVGCGPGSITLGFAEAVAPGNVVGVDFQPSQVAQAQHLLAKRGLSNLRFEVADAYKLPFPDNSFDAVFAHAVLWHLQDPQRALGEMRRVLRAGGLVAIRDCDWGGRICTPTTPLLDEWWTITVKARQRNGGNPFLGRHLRRLLNDAGFERVHVRGSTWTAGTAEEIRLCATFLKAQLKGFASTALTEGWLDQSTIDAVASEIDVWSRHPEAFYSDTYCEALGFR